MRHFAFISNFVSGLVRETNRCVLQQRSTRWLGRLSLRKRMVRVWDSPEPRSRHHGHAGGVRSFSVQFAPTGCCPSAKTRFVIAFVFVCGLVRPTSALTPGDLSRVAFEQHPGQQVSRNLVFRDEGGHALKLGDLFGKRPVILALGYYRCPMLCTMINDGLINTLENLRASVGSDFEVVDLSIDPNEQPAAAKEKKALYVRRYGRSGTTRGWHCLVGDEKSIAQLANEIGYCYAYDPETKQYAHPSGVIVLTPDGKISRYIFGVTFNATELRDALAAAKEGKSGSVLSQLSLLCYHYNPITGKYAGLILSILQIASVATLLALCGVVALMVRRDRRARGGQLGQPSLPCPTNGLPELRDP
jgi:protein SCO1/2